MAENDIERAFAALSEALTLGEGDMKEEITLLEKQIEELKGRVIEINGKQETLVHDRQAIQEMYGRYSNESAEF